MNGANLQFLNRYSPHLLQGLLRRYPMVDLVSFERLFALAMISGGEKELDFLRPETETSFNPRPARVALILMNEIATWDLSVISASLVAGSLCLLDSHPEVLELVTKEELETARIASQIPGMVLSTIPREGVNHSAAWQVAGCLWLDRLRHLHRSPEWKYLLGRDPRGAAVEAQSPQEDWTVVSDHLSRDLIVWVTENFLKFSGEENSRLSHLFKHWLGRFHRLCQGQRSLNPVAASSQ